MNTWKALALVASIICWPAAGQEGFVTLFNGKDLKGWKTTSSHWVVENGLLALQNRTDGEEHNDSYLWTARPYGDFILELEYKVPPDQANSGVFLRTSDVNDPVQTGIEVQVINAEPNRPPRRNGAGSIYDLVAPRKNMHRNGEWNRYIITCRGGQVSVNLNGEVISEANLDQWTELHKNPDGSSNKFNRPLKAFARTGYIGLQDHGLPVWFRNIRIKPLDR